MNKPELQNEEIERLLKRAHLPEPSSRLHDQVVAAARQAWSRMPADIPWQIPLRRLALSAVATLLIVSAANHLGNRVLPRMRPYSSATGPVTWVRDASEDTPYRWSTPRFSRRPVNGQMIRERMENLNRMLEAINHNGT